MAIKKIPLPQIPARREIVVDVATQTLRVMDGASVVAEFPVSTSRFGIGCEEGSLRTPPGRFVIHRKIGDGARPWAVFRSREDTGLTAGPGGDEDLVLTRILTLDGLDADNANSLQRYIYIHGTNQEDLVGTPASHGCVRLRNTDMIELYDMVSPGTSVTIAAPEAVETME